MRWVETLGQDLRFAVRLLTKERWFTAASIGALALGIGVTTMMVTVINGYNFRGLPVDHPQRIVHLGTRDFSGKAAGVSYLDYQDWRAASRSVPALEAFASARMTVSEPGRSPETVSGAYVSAGALAILDVSPVLGRGLLAADDEPGASPVVLIGHRLWISRYGGNATVLGQSAIVNGMSATIVGVMADGFEFPYREGLWLPLAQLPGVHAQPRDERGLGVFGRLSSGVSIDAASAEFAGIAAGLARDHPETNDRVRPTIERFGVQQVGRFGNDLPPLAILVTALFVLLIACANVANLLLARSAGRAQEMAIRGSVGATRGRIVQQLLVESAVLSVVALAVGLWLSTFGVRYIADAFGRNVPYWMSFPIDGQVLAVAVALCAMSTLLFGLAPAIIVSRPRAGGALIENSRDPAGQRPRRWTQAFLVAELVVTTVLLAGAGLIVRSFVALYRGDRVVEVSSVQTAVLELPAEKFATPAARSDFYQRLDERLGAMGGGVLASVASSRPFAGAFRRRLSFSDQPAGAVESRPPVAVVAIGRHYFDVLRVRTLRGDALARAGSAPERGAAIVNQRFVDTYSAEADPIGRLIRLADPRDATQTTSWLTIAGVVPTIRQHIASGAGPVVYVPLSSYADGNAAILVNSAAGSVVAQLRQEVAALDEDVTLFNVRPLRALLEDSRLQHRLMGSVLAVFSGIALLLSMVGVYAVTAYGVRQRRHEIGVRLALGAQPHQVVWMFVRRGLGLIAVGLPIGLAGAVAIGQVVRGLLIQTSPTDVVTLGLIGGLVVGVTVTACFLPARAAARLDPLAVLRRG